DHPTLGCMHLSADGEGNGAASILFTENETNTVRLFGATSLPSPAKDAFHEFIVNGRHDVLASEPAGTKAAFHYVWDIPAGQRRLPRSPTSARRSNNGGRRLMISTRASCARPIARWRQSGARRWPACSGRSSSTSTSYRPGSTAIPRNRLPHRNAGTAAMRTG